MGTKNKVITLLTKVNLFPEIVGCVQDLDDLKVIKVSDLSSVPALHLPEAGYRVLRQLLPQNCLVQHGLYQSQVLVERLRSAPVVSVVEEEVLEVLHDILRDIFQIKNSLISQELLNTNRTEEKAEPLGKRFGWVASQRIAILMDSQEDLLLCKDS